MNRRKYNTLSTHLVEYHFLFDQPKHRKLGLIFKALQGRLWTPFLITAVAQGHVNPLVYGGSVSHQHYRPLTIGQLLAEVLLQRPPPEPLWFRCDLQTPLLQRAHILPDQIGNAQNPASSCRLADERKQ